MGRAFDTHRGRHVYIIVYSARRVNALPSRASSAAGPSLARVRVLLAALSDAGAARQVVLTTLQLWTNLREWQAPRLPPFTRRSRRDDVLRGGPARGRNRTG